MKKFILAIFGLILSFIKGILAFISTILVVIAFIIGLAIFYTFWILPDLNPDANETKLTDFSPYLVDATLAIEAPFYSHNHSETANQKNHFIKYADFCSPVYNECDPILQTLVNQKLSRSKASTLKYDVDGILLSIKFNLKYGKDQILETYLNNAYYEEYVKGAKDAAEDIFEKSVKDLSLAESAFLAGLPYDPQNLKVNKPEEKENIEEISEIKDELESEIVDEEEVEENESLDNEDVNIYENGRQDLVLEEMLKYGMITKKELNQALEDIKNKTIINDDSDE